MIYQYNLNDGKERGWYETYTHFYHHHQNVYVYVKVRVSNILGPTSTSSIITHTMTYYIVTNKIIDTMIIIIYTKQSTMVNWVMGGRVVGLGPISISPITTNILFHIERRRVDGIFRPISTSSIINTSITPIVTIIQTFISPPITTTTSDITPLGAMTTLSYYLIFMNISVNKTRIN